MMSQLREAERAARPPRPRPRRLAAAGGVPATSVVVCFQIKIWTWFT